MPRYSVVVLVESEGGEGRPSSQGGPGGMGRNACRLKKVLAEETVGVSTAGETGRNARCFAVPRARSATASALKRKMHVRCAGALVRGVTGAR